MKQLLIFFILSLIISIANAQYYELPTWVEDLSYSGGSNEIYAIGISDPRMKDEDLAEKIAVHRALTMAVMFKESNVFYASDYFEKKTEEYRWFVVKEEVEELGKVTAEAWVDKTCYQIISKDVNQNGETVVLIKYIPSAKTSKNFFVTCEYYRKDFEVSNTRAMESVRSVNLVTAWKEPNEKDSIKTSFYLSNWNNSITTEIYYGEEKITPPGFSYEYKPTIAEGFDMLTYNTSVRLNKGLWIAYIDTYMQSIMRLSKNYSMKMETVWDDYKVSRNDGISEVSQESLARSASRNVLSFEYGGFGINKNQLFPRVFLKGERTTYRTFASIQAETDSIQNEVSKKKCFLKRWFSKKR